MYTPCFLGEDCEAIHRWMQMRLPVPFSPFNHKAITTNRLIKLFNDDFSDLCLRDNLKIVEPVKGYEKAVHNCFRVIELIGNDIGMELWHNFPSNQNFEISFNNFNEKMKKEILLFREMILYDLKPIMFIHKKTIVDSIANFTDLENQFKKLVDAISYLRNGKKFLLVGLGHLDKFNENWNIENLKTYKISSHKIWLKKQKPDYAWLKLMQMCDKKVTFI